VPAVNKRLAGLVSIFISHPGVKNIRWSRMSRRTYGEKSYKHNFICIIVPVGLQKTALRRPSHGIAVIPSTLLRTKEFFPLNSLIYLFGFSLYILAEIFSGG